MNLKVAQYFQYLQVNKKSLDYVINSDIQKDLNMPYYKLI